MLVYPFFMDLQILKRPDWETTFGIDRKAIENDELLTCPAGAAHIDP